MESSFTCLQVAHSELLEVRPDLTEDYPGIFSYFKILPGKKRTRNFVSNACVWGTVSTGDLDDLVCLLRQALCAL